MNEQEILERYAGHALEGLLASTAARGGPDALARGAKAAEASVPDYLAKAAFTIARAMQNESRRVREAGDGLLAAAKKVHAGLAQRMADAPGNAVPVFEGIAELQAAIFAAEDFL